MIRCFTDLNQTFGKEDITSPLLSSSRAIEWQKNHPNALYQYVDQIDTSLYEDFRINIKSINDPTIYKLGYEMIETCDEIHMKKFKQLTKILVPLCLEPHYVYIFNILRMIILCYHLYVGNEIYAMAYNKKINRLNDHLFIKNTMSKWDDDIIWEERLR